MTDVGRVSDLRSYPVKSMDAATTQTADVTTAGLADDRGWSVIGADGHVINARRLPALLDVTASPGGDGPVLQIPGRTGPVSGPDADAALSAYVGVTVRVRPVEGSGHMVAPVHLVSVQAMARARAERDAGDDADCEIEEPRANITIDLGADPPSELERAWLGQQVRVGSVILGVTAVPKHCLGVFAEVVAGGRLNLGDAVETRG